MVDWALKPIIYLFGQVLGTLRFADVELGRRGREGSVEKGSNVERSFFYCVKPCCAVLPPCPPLGRLARAGSTCSAVRAGHEHVAKSPSERTIDVF